LPDDNSECEPPDLIRDAEIKLLSANGSVGFSHVRVGQKTLAAGQCEYCSLSEDRPAMYGRAGAKEELQCRARGAIMTPALRVGS